MLFTPNIGSLVRPLIRLFVVTFCRDVVRMTRIYYREKSPYLTVVVVIAYHVDVSTSKWISCIYRGNSLYWCQKFDRTHRYKDIYVSNIVCGDILFILREEYSLEVEV